MHRRLALPLAILFVCTSAFACGGTSEREDASDALYSVPSASAPGESRIALLSEVPAFSRDAAARARQEPDAIVATWHVHHVVTDAGFGAMLIYGADRDGMVRLALVLDDQAKTLSVVQPDPDATSEPALAEIAREPQRAIEDSEKRWFADELARLDKLVEARFGTGADVAGAAQTQAFQMSAKCAARLATTTLAIASSFVLSPAGGLVVAAVESAAWGDFEGATIVGATGAASVGANVLAKSESELLRNTGAVLKTLGKAGGIGVVGLVGVTLVFDPKLVVDVITPPQCQADPKR